MPTNKEIAKLKEDIKKGVAHVANKLPDSFKGVSNSEYIALELYFSKELLKQAEERNKLAIQSAIEAGVMFDHKIEPRADGTNEIIYPGKHVSVLLTVKTGSVRMDKNAFISALIKRGVNTKIITAAETEATTRATGAHTFTPTLNVTD